MIIDRAILGGLNRSESVRQRDLPAEVVGDYVIAPALYMQSSYHEVFRCLLEGVQSLDRASTIKVAGKSGISQARTRLGWEAVRALHDDVVKPIANKTTKGPWYGAWRLVSLDGSTLDVADEMVKEAAFGRPGASRERSAFPQIRFVPLVENGTHEITLAKTVVAGLDKDMLCRADRAFFGFAPWTQPQENGADLLWRIGKNLQLSPDKRLADSSYLSRIYSSQRDFRHKTNGVVVRIIDYALDGLADAEPVYRLATTILDPEQAPAHELAAVYHERWEIETAFDKLKTHLRGARIVLRSKTPDLVRQEFYGLLTAHFAIRSLIHEAALKVDEAPDRLSVIHAVRVIRRKIQTPASFSPSAAHDALLAEILDERLPPRRERRNPRGVKRK